MRNNNIFIAHERFSIMKFISCIGTFLLNYPIALLLVLLVLAVIVIWIFKKWIYRNRSTIIKSLILYPFVMTLELVLETSIFINLNTNKAFSFVNDLIHIFGYISILSIMLILLTLIVSNAVDKNSENFDVKRVGKPIIFIFNLFLPFFLLPNINKKSLTVQDVKNAVLSFIFCSLVLSYLFADTFSKFGSDSLNLGSKLNISKEWIGFLGTIISAIISMITAILINK